jgi:hypothetical protein
MPRNVGDYLKKNNERRYVREIRLIKLNAKLPQIRLMIRVKARIMARIMIN